MVLVNQVVCCVKMQKLKYRPIAYVVFLLIIFTLVAPIESDKQWTVDADGVTKIRECADESCNLKPETVHGLIRRMVREYPASTAIATKVDGEWKKWTYTEYYQDIRRAAKSFLKVNYFS